MAIVLKTAIAAFHRKNVHFTRLDGLWVHGSWRAEDLCKPRVSFE